MRRILTLALLAAATPALAGEPVRRPEAAPPTKAEPAGRRCEPVRLQPVVVPFTPGLRRLTELPPANLERPVNRLIDGCPVPVIVRYGLDDRRANPPPR